MRSHIVAALLTPALVTVPLTVTRPLAAQSRRAPANAAPPVFLVARPEARFEIGRLTQARDAVVAIGADGRVAAMPRFGGELRAYDASGGRELWKVATGRRTETETEIGMASGLGWLGDSVYVIDDRFRQVALIDPSGKVFKSIEYPSRVHPSWAERRKYPVFASMQPTAMLPDHSMLVIPGRERSLLTVTAYDRTVEHLLHISASGAIDRSVATWPLDRGVIAYRDIACSRALHIPASAHVAYAVSTNARHITVLQPGMTAADSGWFRVTSLSERGDTAWSRLVPQPIERVSVEAVERSLASVEPCGTHTADEIRASARRLIPAYRSFATGIIAGTDGSVAVLLRTTADSARLRTVLVIDPRGVIVGSLELSFNHTVAAVSRDHLWIVEPGKAAEPSMLVRYLLEPTTARPARTVPVSSSSTPSRPRG